MENLDMTDFVEMLQVLQEELSSYQVDLSLSSLWETLQRGEWQFDWAALGEQLQLLVQKEVLLNFDLLGKFMVLAVAFSLVKQLSTAFGKQGLQEVCNFVMAGIAGLFMLASTQSILTLGEQTIETLSSLMLVLLPLDLILLIGLGHSATAAILQPSLLMAVQVITALFRYLLVPLLFWEFTLKLVSHLGGQIQLTKMAKLLRKIILWSIGLATTCFMAVLSIQGISGTVADSVALRAVKYAAGAGLPVVGGTVANLLEIMLNGSLLLKNGLGLFGLILILLLTVFPLAKIFVLYVIYVLAAALLQPLQADELVLMLEDMAESIILVFAVVTIIALMFFMMLLILLTAANTGVALR